MKLKYISRSQERAKVYKCLGGVLPCCLLKRNGMGMKSWWTVDTEAERGYTGKVAIIKGTFSD